MADSPIVFYPMAAVVAYMIGLSKGGLGGTLAAMATPMMALVMPTDLVIGLVLPILMLADFFAVILYWQQWDRRIVLLLLPGTITGVTLGTVFITNAPTEALRTGLGIIVLLFAIYKIFEERILQSLTYQSRSWHGLLAGTVTGFSSTLAHTGGPPTSIYLLFQNLTPRVFIATSALFFMILNWIKVPFYIYAQVFDLPRLWQIVWLLPLVPLGVWSGRWAASKVDKRAFERVIVALLAMTALLLIFT